MTDTFPTPPAHHDHHDHHTADPAALEDPVHHDVAVHELEVEAESDEEEDEDGDADPDPVDADPPADLVPDEEWEVLAGGTEPTGDARVDAAIDRLNAVRGTRTADHVAVYEDVHRQLQDALADLDGG